MRKTVSMIWTFSLLMAFPVRGGETSPNATELPEDPAYHMRLAVRKAGVILDGPTDDAQAEGTDFIKGHDMDAAGNIYWSESNSPVIFLGMRWIDGPWMQAQGSSTITLAMPRTRLTCRPAKTKTSPLPVTTRASRT